MTMPVCTTCSHPYDDCECTDTINIWAAAGEVHARFAAEDNGVIVSITHNMTPARTRELAAQLLDLANVAEAPPEAAS